MKPRGKELLLLGLDAAVLYFLYQVITGAFTQRQKEWIRERDGRCMFPDPHPCNGHKKTLQVHHIICQRYAQMLGMKDWDYPENGISLCEYSHQRLVHPDMLEALVAYQKGDKEAFKHVFTKRNEKLRNREVYWEPKWDRLFHVIAIRNTQNATVPFPYKKQKALR